MPSNCFTRRNILAGLAASLAAPAWAQGEQTGSIAAMGAVAANPGKLATRTAVIADRNEAAMVTRGSEEAMQGAIAMYEEIVAQGGWTKLPNAKLDRGAKSKVVVKLRERLVREGYLDLDNLGVAAPDAFDDDLARALKSFQYNHGIYTSGKVESRTYAALNMPAEHRLFQLQDNLPRVRAYGEGLGSRNILVNIPSVQLETVEDGIVFARHNVVCGKLERPTPTLASKVSDVTFNPYWNAPASIVARDILPKFLEDPGYLDQMRIRVFDGVGGPEIDPRSVDWYSAAPDRYHFRQEPGEHNSLATVKVNFANKFMVYMHDTPHRELFAINARYESSGCVRVDQVRMFVDWILAGQDGFDEAQFEMITASEETFPMPVKSLVDVRFMYLTAWATEDGRVNFRPDVYKLDGKEFVFGQPEPVAEM
ncbi:MAG: L,D-transpeptidase family protein [Rhizobiales bacterium]|nr:L,D-transpeptidase family protein [Hyphomicrobiales bacterium]